MPHDPRQCLEDVRKATGMIRRFVGSSNFAQYTSNDLLRAGVEREFIIIGEALNRLLSIEPHLAARISNYRQIIAFSNILVHGYSVIDDQIVWDAVVNHLPPLAHQVDVLLAQLNQP
jgi:uncharacterized protein with HEPN domain